MAKRGRPSTYTQEAADEILSRMAEGELVVDIARSSHLPSPGVIWKWTRLHRDFGDAYARAREVQGHVLAERAAARGLQCTDNPQADRLAFDAMRWLAGKVAPRHYSDKVQLSGDPDSPVTIAVRRIVDVPGDGSGGSGA